MLVLRVVVVVDEVPAVHVVDVTVAVVVDAVAGDLAGVDPQVGGQVGERRIDARVDDGDHLAAADRRVPCRRRIRDVQPPQVEVRLPPRVAARVERIVRYERDVPVDIRLGVLDVRIGGQAGGGRGGVRSRIEVEHVDARQVGRRSHPARRALRKTRPRPIDARRPGCGASVARRVIPEEEGAGAEHAQLLVGAIERVAP